MVKKSEAIKWVKEQEGKWIDIDLMWGAQCVDLPNGYLREFYGIRLWGNAIDLLDNAKKQGMTVIYDAPGVNPKAGDIIVLSVPEHNYGHVGIVLEDSDGYTIKTLEQNVDGYSDNNNDGINDQLQVGGKATIIVRNFDGVIGWIRPDFEQEEENMNYTEEQMIRQTPQVGVAPYRQVHAHSTGNSKSTAIGEASYMNTKDLNTGFYTHVVGNGRVIQVAYVGQGAWDVGGGWNNETFAAVELIESHSTFEEFYRDYRIYVQLLRDLADQGGIPKTLDSSDLAGIKTHYYCTYNQPNNASDHIDPYHYLAKWGISKEQFKKDIENGIDESFKVEEKTVVDYLDENITLANREYPYYKGYMDIDYYVEEEYGKEKEFLPKGTEVWVYEKKNGYSRINSHSADQWVEDKYIVGVLEVIE